MSQCANTTEKPPKEPSLLVAFILVLVIVHLLFTLVVPIAFIYEIRLLLSFSEDAFYVWLSQPILIAICLKVVNSDSRRCRALLWVDVGLSLPQIASVFLLCAIADKIG